VQTKVEPPAIRVVKGRANLPAGLGHRPVTAGHGPIDPAGMEDATRLPDRIPARALALVSGVVGLVAGLFLLGFFALDVSGVRLAGVLGLVNDALGAVQFAALAPVALALGRRLPASRTMRVAMAVAVAAMVAFAILSVLLATGLLTFSQQIGPVMVAILVIYAWLLLVNLVAHRSRTLPRSVTSTGVLLGVALGTGLVLVAAGYVLPGTLGQLATWLGYGLAAIAWLALPVYVLLLATRVFSVASPSGVPAPAGSVQGVRS
jgi:hypothetical protein